jgi:uncharacterized protein YjiS (DUF1127 family)
MLAPVVDIDIDAEAAGCRRLWCAVLAQALHDAFVNVTVHTSGTSATKRDEARRFLFAERGAWAEARRQVCALADISEEALVERLKSKPAQEAIPGRRERKEQLHLSPTRKRVATSRRARSEEVPSR